MAKAAPSGGYRCVECGWSGPRWAGRCSQCQAWGSVEERGTAAGASATASTRARPAAVAARPISEVDARPAATWPTGIDDLDQVLGGGLVSGAVVLLAGEPGTGKSTLLLDVASRAATASRTVLYVSGEESAAQVRLRAERIGALRPRLLLAAETDLGTVLGHIEATDPGLLIVDSVQTIGSDAVDGSAGSLTQVREVTAALVRAAKQRGMATILVGHVTKDGSLAGPRTMEHLVDVVCYLEGDRHSRLRLLRAVKNRYGPTDEIGCFDLSETGMVALPDPSSLFLSRHSTPVSGTSVTVTLEGRRPLLAEVQALVTPSATPNPRRTNSGLDGSRVALMLAVLDRRAGLRVGSSDVYLSTVGGVRLAEPANDLAVALAVASSLRDLPLPPGLVAIGEVGLAGEVRRASGVSRRLAEAGRLGFSHAMVPAGTDDSAPDGMTVHEVPDLTTALLQAGMYATRGDGEGPARMGPRAVG